MLHCPACKIPPMESQVSHGIEVELCRDCGGIWLDAGEFDALIGERFHGQGFEALFGLRGPGGSDASAEAAVACPVDGAAMHVVHFDEVELDRCPICHGIWIDGHERAQLPAANPGVLDRPALGGADSSMERVDCGGCGANLPRLRCMRRMDAFWCEACVIEGNYPGGYGPPVSRRIAEAAQSMAEANAELGQRKNRQRQIQAAKARPPGITHRGAYRGEAELWVLTDAVETVARSLKRLFRRERGS